MSDDTAKALRKMREPFGKNQISLLPKPTKKENAKGKCKECGGYHGLPAVHIKYVGHAALTDRLLDVDPFWNWEPVKVDEYGAPVLDKYGGMWIKLTVCGVTRLGYGDAGGKNGPDANKERIGDALRNAAMRFGAALDLWHKGDLHIPKDSGNNGKSEEEMFDASVDWINSFIKREASVEYFDKQMKGAWSEKFTNFSADLQEKLKGQEKGVRDYLIEMQEEAEQQPTKGNNGSKLNMEV